MLKYIITVIIGLVIGTLGGLQGFAGSSEILALLLLTGVAATQREAAGIALAAVAFPTTLSAAYKYYKNNDLNLTISIILIITLSIASYFGASLNYQLPKKTVYYITGLTTILSSLYFFYKGITTK